MLYHESNSIFCFNCFILVLLGCILPTSTNKPLRSFYICQLSGRYLVVPRTRDPSWYTDIRTTGGPVGGRDHPGGDGDQAPPVPWRLGNRRNL